MPTAPPFPPPHFFPMNKNVAQTQVTNNTVQKKWERISAKKLRTFGASIVLVPAKFRKLGDEPKRKFAAWTEITCTRHYSGYH